VGKVLLACLEDAMTETPDQMETFTGYAIVSPLFPLNKKYAAAIRLDHARRKIRTISETPREAWDVQCGRDVGNFDAAEMSARVQLLHERGYRLVEVVLTIPPTTAIHALTPADATASLTQADLDKAVGETIEAALNACIDVRINPETDRFEAVGAMSCAIDIQMLHTDATRAAIRKGAKP
jgi:hypothetical protein